MGDGGCRLAEVRAGALKSRAFIDGKRNDVGLSFLKMEDNK